MFNNKDVRQMYIEKIQNIPNLIDRTKSLREQAIQAFELRNRFRTEARNAMIDQEAKATLEKMRPNPTFEEMLRHKTEDKGLSYKDALRAIIKMASTTNKEVDGMFEGN